MQHLTIRRFDSPPTDDIPRHWFHGEPAATHLLNAYTLLVPDNEGFYIRTLNATLPRLESLELRTQVREFSRQEGQHGVAHKRAWRWLAAQGYRFDGFVRFADKAAFAVVEKIAPLPLRCAIVACVEHLNAAIGHEYLRRGLMDGVHPAVASLYEWHFAEEIEHKAVAFDVLETFRGAYALRLIGALLVLPLFYLLMGIGATLLAVQDGSARRVSTWTGWFSHAFGRRGTAWRMAAHVVHYLKPGFAPWQLDDRALADAAIARWPQIVPTAPAPTHQTPPAVAPLRAA